MLIFLIYIIGVLGTFVLATAGLSYVAVSLVDRRPCPLRIPVGMILGYVAGARLVWTLVPRDWELPFWTTLSATVNAEKYGHAVEHSAEGIAIWIAFGGVVGAIAGGLAARVAGGSRPSSRTVTHIAH